MPVWIGVFLLIISQWPFNPEWEGAIKKVNIKPTAWRCHRGAVACYYDETIHLDFFDREAIEETGGYERVYMHELGHHLQVESRICERPGGWKKFKGIVSDLAKSGRYQNVYQKRSLKLIMSWQPHDLHAELPIVLKGEIPRELRRWYPWFGTS
jgi:hypothetical protein